MCLLGKTPSAPSVCMVPVRIISPVFMSEILHRPLANSTQHPALSNLETERSETFDKGTNIVFFNVIQLMEFLPLEDFIQMVAFLQPEDETDESPKPVMVFVSSLLTNSKSERIL